MCEGGPTRRWLKVKQKTGRSSGSTASVARGWPGVLTMAPGLTPAAEPSHHPAMDHRRFLLSSLAGALAAPLAAGAVGVFVAPPSIEGQQSAKLHRIAFL